MIDRWAHTQIYDKMMLDDTGHYVKHADHLTEVKALQEEVGRLKKLLIDVATTGYECGHNDTVESCYGCVEEKCEDIVKEALSTEPSK